MLAAKKVEAEKSVVTKTNVLATEPAINGNGTKQDGFEDTSFNTDEMFNQKLLWPISKLRTWDKNPRVIKTEDFERLKKQIKELGQYKPLICTPDGEVLGGNMRLKALLEMDIRQVYVSIVYPKSDAEKLKYALSDNDRVGYYVEDELAELLHQYKDEINLSDFKVDLGNAIDLEDFANNYGPEERHAKLSEKFGVPPFSVFDTRQGYWQDRKALWLGVGMNSEIGRADDLTYGAADGDDIVSQKIMEAGGGTSIFDPVLTEIMYRWYCPEGGLIVDPFAGGSVRGIVASILERQYIGIDLSEEQIKANRDEADIILEKRPYIPTWHIGDSRNIDQTLKGVQADLIFSCPPYADLEVYSKDPSDLSNMDFTDFLIAYKEIIRKSVDLLKPDRFAIFVVSEARNKQGFYYGLVPYTIQYFEEAGASLYNEAILVNALGSLPLRAGKTFQASRKLGRAHQNVLIFYKGDPKNIKQNFGEVVIGEVEEFNDQMQSE